ncbi:hypothetical protein POX_f08100 [Penicillium oxalicum]|uniref:hypothetical protein n=1 Tax=Penicillium oxalicum TaxID=69781 RepID=UPI0020B8AEB7|nr:hypothetical protein POX_f08100 [Penicillium oxalicum]KAI2787725.1 hypothetical protein POX_f08100 [Penicillium oxalicum]
MLSRFTPGPPRSGYVPAHSGGPSISSIHGAVSQLVLDIQSAISLKSIDYLHCNQTLEFNDLHGHETGLRRVQPLMCFHPQPPFPLPRSTLSSFFPSTTSRY